MVRTPPATTAPRPHQGHRRILLAVDGSEASLRAARYAGALLRGLPEATVTLVHVIRPPANLAAAAAYVPDVPLDVMVRRTAEPVLDRARAALGLPAHRVREEVLVDPNPAAAVAALARAEGCDLIVCGHRHLSGLRRLLHPSVSRALVRRAPCPVLVVD